MKTVIAICISVLFIQTALCQQNKTDQTLKNERMTYDKLNSYIDSLFNNTRSLNKCTSGFLFVRFVIDKKGMVTDLQTNEGTPSFLDSIFKQALKRSNGLWGQTKINSKHIVSKYYILPVLYSLHIGCKIDTSSKKIGPMEALLKTIPNDVGPNKDGFVYSFLNMINFKKTESMAIPRIYHPLECILLTPFELRSPIY